MSDEEEIKRAMVRTLQELGAEVTVDMDHAELVKASEALADTRSANGFKTCEGGLYLEGRHVKAAIRESVNVFFAGEKRGPTKKGVRNYWAERVFIDPDVVLLGRDKPDGTQLFIGHVSGPNGPSSNLTRYDYVSRATVNITLMAMRKAVPDKEWPLVWLTAGELGLGALRSQGFGRYDVTDWKQVKTDPERLAEARRISALYRSEEEREQSDAAMIAAISAARANIGVNGSQAAQEAMLVPVG